MFGILSDLTKAAVSVAVDMPLSILADVATLGGACTDRNEPYTATAIRRLKDNVERAVDPGTGSGI